MIYPKMPVVLLSTLASEKSDSTNHIIAQYILSHEKEFYHIGIKELAERCHVGTGSVSRFVRDIGLEDFSELKEILRSNNATFESFKTSSSSWQKELTEDITLAMQKATTSLDLSKIDALCEDMHTYSNIISLGLLKAQAAVIDLQMDMMLLGKQIQTNISYKEQLSLLQNATKDTLVIIFSYTGSYFDYQSIRNIQRYLKMPKIWMICAKGKPLPDFVNDSITFDSDLKQIHHPYQLQVVETIIAQNYAKLFRE